MLYSESVSLMKISSFPRNKNNRLFFPTYSWSSLFCCYGSWKKNKTLEQIREILPKKPTPPPDSASVSQDWQLHPPTRTLSNRHTHMHVHKQLTRWKIKVWLSSFLPKNKKIDFNYIRAQQCSWKLCYPGITGRC